MPNFRQTALFAGVTAASLGLIGLVLTNKSHGPVERATKVPPKPLSLVVVSADEARPVTIKATSIKEKAGQPKRKRIKQNTVTRENHNDTVDSFSEPVVSPEAEVAKIKARQFNVTNSRTPDFSEKRTANTPLFQRRPGDHFIPVVGVVVPYDAQAAGRMAENFHGKVRSGRYESATPVVYVD